MKSSLEKSIVIAFLMAIYCMDTFAETRAKETGITTITKENLKFDKKTKTGHWQVWESETCAFLVKQSTQKNISQQLALKIPDCENTVETNYEVLPNKILLANWMSERGGVAYLFHLSQQKLFWLEVSYMSSDESPFDIKVTNNDIIINTDRNKIRVAILSDGSLKQVNNGVPPTTKDLK